MSQSPSQSPSPSSSSNDQFTLGEVAIMSLLLAIVAIAYWLWKTPTYDWRIPLCLLGIAPLVVLLYAVCMDYSGHMFLYIMWFVMLTTILIMEPLEKGRPLPLVNLGIFTMALLMGTAVIISVFKVVPEGTRLPDTISPEFREDVMNRGRD